MAGKTDCKFNEKGEFKKFGYMIDILANTLRCHSVIGVKRFKFSVNVEKDCIQVSILLLPKATVMNNTS